MIANTTQNLLTRRRFLSHTSAGLGMAAVASLLGASAAVQGRTHFTPRAKNVIYLFMAGGPSHVDLFDHKPMLRQRHGQEMPPSVLGIFEGDRNTGNFNPLHSATLGEWELPIEQAVTGSRTLSITVTPNE